MNPWQQIFERLMAQVQAEYPEYCRDRDFWEALGMLHFLESLQEDVEAGHPLPELPAGWIEEMDERMDCLEETEFGERLEAVEPLIVALMGGEEEPEGEEETEGQRP